MKKCILVENYCIVYKKYIIILKLKVSYVEFIWMILLVKALMNGLGVKYRKYLKNNVENPFYIKIKIKKIFPALFLYLSSLVQMNHVFETTVSTLVTFIKYFYKV